MNRKSLLVTSALVAVTLASSTAFMSGAALAATDADDQPQSTASPGPRQSDELEGVTVTVNKRNQDVQDVATAVTAYSSEQRDQLGVISIFDMTRAVPSFEYTTTLDRSFIRGVGRNTNAPGTQAGVTIYVDGVYTSSTYGLDRAPILSGTFEADAGPQGTLFGRNAIGGVLQQNSAHATDHFEIRTDTRYNDHNRFDQAVSIGGPIGEHLKWIVAGNVRKQTDGYFTNLATGRDQGGPTSERLYYSILDFNFGSLLNGFWKIQTSGFNRYMSGFSQYGSASTNANPLFNDYSTSSTALNLNPYINCNAIPASVAFPADSYNATYGAGTYARSPTTYNPAGIRSLTTCLPTQGQASTYYDPTNPSFTSPYLIRQDFRTRATGKDTWETVLQNTWHLEGVDLKYVGGYNQYVYDNLQDGDGNARGPFNYDPDGIGASPSVTIYPIINQYYENRHWDSHDLTLSSTGDGPLSWITGMYRYSDTFHNLVDNYSSGQTQLSASNLNNPNRNFYRLDYLAKTQALGVYGQFDYKFTPKWTFTGGIRWNKDNEQTTENSHYYVFSPGNTLGLTPFIPGFGYYAVEATTAFGIGATCTPPAGVTSIAARGATCSAINTTASYPTSINVAGINQRQINDVWTGWGGVANLQYKPNDDTLVYLKYSRGYKAGGIVLSGMTASPILDPESLNAYEVGYKFSPSRKVTINTSAYYYDYRNYQDFGSVRNPSAPSGFSTIGFNIPKSTNWGAEITSSWHPTPNFTLTATGNYMNAEVKDGGAVTLVDNLDPSATGTVTLRDRSGATTTLHYTPQPCGASFIVVTNGVPVVNQPQCLTGDSLKGASPWKIFLSADYRFDFDAGSLDAIVNYSSRAGNVSTYSQNPVYESPSYNEIDVRMVWAADGGKYKVIGFVNNVANKIGTEYVTASADASGSLFVNQQLTIPRTWGIELQAKF